MSIPMKMVGLVSGLMFCSWVSVVQAQTLESAACRSPNPSDWPEPAKPYFMIVVDSSGSMDSGVSPAPSCSGYAATRSGHARCAVYNTIEAFSGLAEFGLAEFNNYLYSCTSGCSCSSTYLAGSSCGDTAGTPVPPSSTSTYAQQRSANIVVPLDPAADSSNVDELLSWVDNSCDGDAEIADTGGSTPLAGALLDIYRYLSDGWTPAGETTQVYATPLSPTDPQCRSVNVILLTDGGENCSGSPTAAAGALLDGFILIDDDPLRPPRSVRTYVIAFGNGDTSDTDPIAAAGGTESAIVAADEAELSAAFADIIASAVAPETCNNLDDNCNGCTDEGYRVYCSRNRAPGGCCEWTAPAERQSCLDSFNASVTPTTPQGDLSLLPCWDPAEDGAEPETKWLCRNPEEICDELDNNCEWDYNRESNGSTRTSEADEGFTKCPTCPSAEICDGLDNDCNGLTDDLPGCSSCIPSPEVCDGFDNDCDGDVDEADDGSPLTVPCALASTAGCQGEIVCTAGSWSACNVTVSAEICDGLDNDCNGRIDDGAPGEPCDPVIPAGRSNIVYNDGVNNLTTTCRRGAYPCGGGSVCVGAVGPTDEICDGLDNDCDGRVDVAWDGSPLPSVGTACGACDVGVVACVDGTLECTFGDEPEPAEVCNGLDDDCDGIVDDAPLTDAPENPGCWQLDAASCSGEEGCSFGELEWCAPEGATCTDTGVLAAPCAAGAMQCVAGAWACLPGRLPSGEVCDGVDNDCNGALDEDLGSPVGDACGAAAGVCELGTIVCDGGVLECSGRGPEPEVCNGLDDDCDGSTDNGIPLGGECISVYDATEFPGDRGGAACRTGRLTCDPEGSGQFLCEGGLGPAAETCDGFDNDCDGRIDESGAAPDGIDGTADPENASRDLGDPCGAGEGVCEPGILSCIDGAVVCAGGLGPQTEECDCKDNDCDGHTDESDPAICSPGKACVSHGGQCFCAASCQSGEFPCASGAYSCETAEVSGSDDEGRYCIPPDPCAECETTTVIDAQGDTECGPGGTNAQGPSIPVCECASRGCHSPCFGITCSNGLRCVPTGSAKGTCQADTCYFFGCESGTMCMDGSCVENPCDDSPCEQDEVCKPSINGSEPRCVASCAGVVCGEAERCVEGQCEPTGCADACDEDEVCLATGACGAGLCQDQGGTASCSDGSYCDPATGSCTNEPCTGVVCPARERCDLGECVGDDGAVGSGAGGSAGSAGAAGFTASAGAADDEEGQGGSENAAGAAGRGESTKVWGLMSGGSKLDCGVARRSGGFLGMAAFVLTAVALRRRRRSGDAAEKGVRV